MWTALVTALIVAFGLEGPAPETAEPEAAPVRVSVALLPGPIVPAGELVTLEVHVAGPPAGQPGADVAIAVVDLVLPDGSVLSMEPTPADPGLYTQHVFAAGRLGPGRHELEVIVLDAEGRERAVTVTLEVVPAALDVARGP